MNRFAIPLLAFVVLIAFLGIGLTLKPRDLPSPFIDAAAPDFILPTLAINGASHGQATRQFNNVQMAGQVWLLNVWASWCAACRDEHPLFNKIAHENIVPIVGLNYKDDADAAIAWLRELGNPYAHIAVDANGDVGIEYGVYGVPETYLIDRAGIIRYKQVGAVSADVLQNELLPLIAKLRAQTP